MSRLRSVEDDEVIARLAQVFSEVGYEGASLALLAQATGLQKASLYHRFPQGKRQMAEEVLAKAGQWLDTQVLQPLAAPMPPHERLQRVIGSLDDFYGGGARACLLNMLSSPRKEEGPFGQAIKAAFVALIDGFARLAEAAGIGADAARLRGERAVMLLQGSLVVARGTGSVAPFRRFLDGLTDELLAVENWRPS